MNGLKKYDVEKLLDDLKLVSKSVKIVTDENNQDNRRFAYGLTEDLINRLYRDIQEMADKEPEKGQTYGCPYCTIKDMDKTCPTCHAKDVCKYYNGGK